MCDLFTEQIAEEFATKVFDIAKPEIVYKGNPCTKNIEADYFTLDKPVTDDETQQKSNVKVTLVVDTYKTFVEVYFCDPSPEEIDSGIDVWSEYAIVNDGDNGDIKFVLNEGGA